MSFAVRLSRASISRYRFSLFGSALTLRRQLLVQLLVLAIVAGSHWPEISRRFPSLTREHCLADMHAVTADGTFSGYDAYRALSKSLPIGWLLRPLLFVPPLPQIGRRLYRHVADRRSRRTDKLSRSRASSPDERPLAFDRGAALALMAFER